MTLIAVTSSRTSPGSTTLAVGLSLAWSHQVDKSLLIEADPAGGVLGLRFGLRSTPSLTTFGSDCRNGYEEDLLWANTQDLRGFECMPGSVDPRLSSSWLERVDPMIAKHVPELSAPTIVDLGRLSNDLSAPNIIKAADRVLVVTRPTIAEIQSLRFRIRQVRLAGGTPNLVVIGDRPHDPHEIARLVDIPLLAVIPDEPALAAALCGARLSERRLRRSRFWRTIVGLGQHLHSPLSHPLGEEQSRASVAATAGLTSSTASSGGGVCDDEPHRIDEDFSDPFAAPIDSTSEPDDCTADRRSATLRRPREWSLVSSNGLSRTVPYEQVTRLGRSAKCEVVIEDDRVSRVHGEIRFTDDHFVYVDAGSTNGSKVNGARVTDCGLADGDELRLGSTTFVFRPSTIRHLESV